MKQLIEISVSMLIGLKSNAFTFLIQVLGLESLTKLMCKVGLVSILNFSYIVNTGARMIEGWRCVGLYFCTSVLMYLCRLDVM